jgi:hypothetical protein
LYDVVRVERTRVPGEGHRRVGVPQGHLGGRSRGDDVHDGTGTEEAGGAAGADRAGADDQDAASGQV